MDWLHHSFFIHLLVDGHLGCLQFLAVIHKAALNICVPVFKWSMFLFLLGKYLGVYLLAHMVSISNFIKKLPCYFLNWFYHWTFPEQGNEGYMCSTALLALGIVIFLSLNHSIRCVEISHFNFNLDFANGLMLNFFLMHIFDMYI